MTTAGIIFSNIHDSNIPELTSKRTMASVPFACKYRLIDFTLSNMVNSNITDIRIVTQYNYQSLMDHIGSGKDWDLARRSGGVKIVPPYISAGSPTSSVYPTRLEALKNVNYSITHITADYVVLSDCDVICNIDLTDMVEYHIKQGADITVATRLVEVDSETAKKNVLFQANDEGRITDVISYSPIFCGKAHVNLNILVINRDYLFELVADAISHGYRSLTRDIMTNHTVDRKYSVYEFSGYYACLSSLNDYFGCSLDLISNKASRNALFNVKNRPVYTKVKNSAPTYISPDAKVSNSLIADDCMILGEVDNSILFRGVKVGKGTVVRNSILFQDVFTGSDVHLNYVLADKNAVICDGVTLSGHSQLPSYIEKGKSIG